MRCDDAFDTDRAVETLEHHGYTVLSPRETEEVLVKSGLVRATLETLSPVLARVEALIRGIPQNGRTNPEATHVTPT